MHWSAIGDVHAVKRILDAGADPNAVDEDGDTALRYVMSSRSVGVLDLLLEHGARADAASTSAGGLPGFCVLHAFAEAGWAEGVTALLGRGAPVDARSVGSVTALMPAAGAGRSKVVQILVQHGADPDAVDSDGDSPMFYAASRGQWSTVRRLLETGANVHASPGANGFPLVVAARLAGPDQRRPPGVTSADYTKVVLELLRAGADASPMYDEGLVLARSFARGLEYSPLENVYRDVTAGDDWFVMKEYNGGFRRTFADSPGRRSESVDDAKKRLLREYSTLDVARNDQLAYESRSLLGSFYAQMGLIGLHFVETRADVLAHLSDGAPVDGVRKIEYEDEIEHWETPLLAALVDGRYAVADALIEAGADPDAPNAARFPSGQGFAHAALHMMVQRGDEEGVRRLIAAGADVNKQTTPGSTPLHLAAEIDSPRIVSMLMRAGADPRIPDLAGALPSAGAGMSTRGLLG